MTCGEWVSVRRSAWQRIQRDTLASLRAKVVTLQAETTDDECQYEAEQHQREGRLLALAQVINLIDSNPSPPDQDQWQPTQDADQDLGTAIRQAIATASMCWAYPAGAGTFDSERAHQVAQGLERWLRERHYIQQGSP